MLNFGSENVAPSRPFARHARVPSANRGRVKARGLALLGDGETVQLRAKTLGVA